ncbi:DUF7344 domain-containing protein [Halopelagius fulvigenes]|uniref:DUF7344 domain-containing protein n=1 Tax=Halopelagius fulvigenes TaxID=1198324 RepID=A0ABD5U595_9EURY
MKETEAFRILGSADRQILLHELVRTDGGVAEEELARRVAARRHRISPESLSEEDIERAHVRLVHFHFPLLRELSIIEQNEDEVSLTKSERRDQLLKAASELEGWPYTVSRNPHLRDPD